MRGITPLDTSLKLVPTTLPLERSLLTKAAFCFQPLVYWDLKVRLTGNIESSRNRRNQGPWRTKPRANPAHSRGRISEKATSARRIGQDPGPIRSNRGLKNHSWATRESSKLWEIKKEYRGKLSIRMRIVCNTLKVYLNKRKKERRNLKRMGFWR